MIIDRAIKRIAQCESEFRKLLAEAADAGDYDSVLKLTSWAKQLAALTAAPQRDLLLNKSEISQAQLKRTTKRNEYPRFGRRGDALVKVGWSKREKKEYEHKAQRRVVDLLIRTLVPTGESGRIFQSTDILPLTDPNDETEVPSYQVYLMLAWLRSIALLDQHGRQGYSVPNVRELPTAVESAWQSLKEV